MKRFYVPCCYSGAELSSGEVRNLRVLNQVYQVCVTNSLHKSDHQGGPVLQERDKTKISQEN